MNDVSTTYRIVEARVKAKLPVAPILLPERYDNQDDGTYIDSVLNDFMDGIGANIDVWAVRNMFLSYGVSEAVADRALSALIRPALTQE